MIAAAGSGALRTGVVPLDPEDPSEIDAVASLHEEYLGDSPVALMGPLFLRAYYYPHLVRDDLIQCVVCRDETGVIGFLSYTDIPNEFMSRGLRSHFLPLAWVMLKSVLRRPSMIPQLLDVLRLLRVRSAEAAGAGAEKQGEALSMAVPERHQKHVPAGGTERMTVRFFRTMEADLRERGCTRIQFMVNPANKAANIFYATIGCRLKKIEYAGRPIHRFTYTIKPESDA
jgi:hypothetical protein